jgi:hypothetical protein
MRRLWDRVSFAPSNGRDKVGLLTFGHYYLAASFIVDVRVQPQQAFSEIHWSDRITFRAFHAGQTLA